MVFIKTVTTSANTLETSPLESWIGISRGLIYRMQVMFPIGSAGLCGVKVFEGGHQVFPVTDDEWLVGANETIDFGDLYLVTVINTKFRILTYNTDDLYDHKQYIRIGIVSKPEFIAHFLPTVGYDQLQELIAEATKEREREEIAAALAMAAQLPEGEIENG